MFRWWLICVRLLLWCISIIFVNWCVSSRLVCVGFVKLGCSVGS